ncbi:hypothetical protein N656DRAFT_707047 [Canariomyces notabilis]|uniref:Zn(2)-C6 fungal-type domain-containing protein n=1 Tax=Canariomyces notabilis TaxID=2074819 RepID=A0AAN6TFV0_9PEZI|nr:hypothetical protein N656DRAFT_707047 [Canariomyces arenarius]
MSALPIPPNRPASTCITCRARKVRCDGRRVTCSNCDRLSLPCSYDGNVGVDIVYGDSGHGTATATAISVPRRRARQACQNCHARKARCSGSLPSCDRCRGQGLECVYRPTKRSLPLPGPATTAASPAGAINDNIQTALSSPNDHGTPRTRTASPAATLGQLDPGEALTLRAFDNFFRHIHHIPVFSFLHRASVMQRYHSGSLARSLVLALVGITALLTDLGPGTEEYGNQCVEEAVSLCLAELEKPTIHCLQTLVIAVKHRILSKRYSGAFMLHAIASRFATALRLNHENPELCFLARESRRRLMWSLYMIDSFISAGQRDLALWPDAEHQIHVQLPCNERNFEFDLPEPTEPLRPPALAPGGTIPPLPDVLGFMALHVRIHWMRTRILQCTSNVAASPSEDAIAMLPSQCADLATELEAFEARLPASFRWSEANLGLRTYSPRLAIFIMTHVWWRQCHLDLYRLFLPGLREALAPAAMQQLDPHFVAHKRRSCYEHARAMADMFAQLLSLGSSVPVTDIDLPACAFQCLRVLYHCLQTEGPDHGFTPERVQELAAVCLKTARQCTAGPASASIQADIERLIANGLLLPEDSPVWPGRARGSAVAVGMPYLDESIPNETPVESFQLPVAAPTIGSTAAGSVPMTETLVASAAPASQASVGTSASNAFEEIADGFNFGPDLFGPESLSAFPGWSTMGHFPGSSM